MDHIKVKILTKYTDLVCQKGQNEADPTGSGSTILREGVMAVSYVSGLWGTPNLIRTGEYDLQLFCSAKRKPYKTTGKALFFPGAKYAPPFCNAPM
jgi:hypothetical protein